MFKIPIFFKSSKELTLVIRSGKAQNNGYLKWVMGVTSILSKLTKFLAFPFSLHLMFDLTFSNLIVYLMIPHKKTTHKCSTSEHIALDTR